MYRLRPFPPVATRKAEEEGSPNRYLDPDDDDWDDIPEFIATPAHALPPEGPTVLSDLLLELTTHTSRLRVLLSEAEEDEFKAALPRFRSFIEEVSRLPQGPTRRKPMGFTVEAKKKPKKPRKPKPYGK